MRRRPLLRAAATAAGSYYMGKHKAEAEQPPPPQSAGPGPSSLDQLEQLGKLHEQGVLTDDEFAQQKAKLLAS